MASGCANCDRPAEDGEIFCRECYEKDLAQRMIEIADTIQPAGLASKGDATDPMIVETVDHG